jgi:dipeptidyl aminopeptidase/acylaminoacyl peptidase
MDTRLSTSPSSFAVIAAFLTHTLGAPVTAQETDSQATARETAEVIDSEAAISRQDIYDPERWALYMRYASAWGPHRSMDRYLVGGIIEPHWMADGKGFWYADGPVDSTVIYRVDPLSKRKIELFDVSRLRDALESFLEQEPPHRGVPFRAFEFVDEERAIRFTVAERDLTLDLETYRLTDSPAEGARQRDTRRGELPSPDGRWAAFIKDYNVWVRSRTDGREIQLTEDGAEDTPWSLYRALWSPDGSRLAAFKDDIRGVPQLPIVTWLGDTAEVAWTPELSVTAVAGWLAAGIRGRNGVEFPVLQSQLEILGIDSSTRTHIDLGPAPRRYIRALGWQPGGSRLLLEAGAYHNLPAPDETRQMLIADAGGGTSHVVLHDEYYSFQAHGLERIYHILADGTGFVRIHEVGNWNQLSIFDWDGEVVRRLTSVPFDVLSLILVDEERGWVYFTGPESDARPYDANLYRVRLDGSGFSRLTEARGTHDGPCQWNDSRQWIQFSPSKLYFIDTYSSPNRPPVVELRRADGTLVQTLSKGSIERLQRELKWTPLEEFVVKAADGVTDLHGVLFKPYDFTPEKTYPVIQIVYGSCAVPRTFTHGPFGWQARALAQLGFIVVMGDTRGALGRGRAFREAIPADSYEGHGVRRAAIKDYAATLEQLGRDRGYMDLARVGVYGYSGGGPNALWAMLDAPDVYHVGVAGAPVREDALLAHAVNLQGKLLLIQPMADQRGGILTMTMRMINALIEAGKPYDLMIMPDENHGLYARPESRPYFLKTLAWYFGKHLNP